METHPHFASDIPESLARSAHAGTSFVPEERAAQMRSEYAETLARDYEALSRFATTEEKRATLAEEFERYREGYRKRTCAWLSSRSRCLSTMVTGPSNFNTRRNEKRNDVADRRGRELVEFRERALAAIRKTLCPELRPIMSGDSDAQERLEEKLKKAEALQERMKAANAAIRKYAKVGPDAQVAALVVLGFPQEIARKLLEPDFCGRIGFAEFEIRNNNANIRRMKARLEGVTRDRATPTTEEEGASARLEDCPAENRVRLFFPGKPEASVRDTLKSGGFRWTPTIGAWQAYRNPGSIALARRVAGVETPGGGTRA